MIHCHGTLASSSLGGMYGTIRYIHGAQLENNGAVLPCHDNVLQLYKVSKGSTYILAVMCLFVQRRSIFTRHHSTLSRFPEPFARPRAILTVPCSSTLSPNRDTFRRFLVLFSGHGGMFAAR